MANNSSHLFNVQHEVSRLSADIYVVLTLLNVCLMLSILGANLIVVWSFAKHRQLRDVHGALTINMAAADLIVGFVGVPYIMVIQYREYKYDVIFDKYTCLFAYFVFNIAQVGSMASFLLSGVVKLVALSAPFVYNRIASTRNVTYLMGCVWIYIVLFASVPIMGYNNWNDGMVCVDAIIFPLPYYIWYAAQFFVVIVGTCVIYIRIGCIAHTVKRQIRNQISMVRRGEQIKQDMRHVKMMAAIIGAFLVSWTPAYVIGIYQTATPGGTEKKMQLLLTYLALYITLTHSFLKPILYYQFRSEFRSALLEICRGCKPKGTDDHMNAG